MDIRLRDLYKELLLTRLRDGRNVFDRIRSDDLCIASHHKGKLYGEGGLLIYGQAMNGWQNKASDPDKLIEELMSSADDYRAMCTMADDEGWQSLVDGNSSSYFYKRSKFWKLNYQVITSAADLSFDGFYVAETNSEKRIELLERAWSQTVAWSNLYKISYSAGGNPNEEIKKSVNDVSLRIIQRELELLKPGRVLFNTGENFFYNIAMRETNVFGLFKRDGEGNVLYSGEYEYCRVINVK